MLKKLLTLTPHLPINRSAFSRIPESPGVYFFLKKGQPLYVGKAVNLKKRLASYLNNKVGPKTFRMLKESRSIGYVKVNSELEALLLESDIIRVCQPIYNTISKDDKHALYIKITNDFYPRVLTARKIDAPSDAKVFFGPFPSSTNVRFVLKLLRKIFPFSDHKISKNPCLYSQIGLCNPCPSFIEWVSQPEEKNKLRRKYLKNIRMLTGVLSRKTDRVLGQLTKEMQKLSRSEKFEDATTLREQIKKIEYISQPITPITSILENPNLLEDKREEELSALRGLLQNILHFPGALTRIECYDVAHISGAYRTASMVTFINGESEKSLYRHYRIRQTKGFDDISSLKEVAHRRLKTLSIWGRPDLIVVDGGKGQAMTFYEVFSGVGIPVIGLAKRLEKIIIPLADGKSVSFITAFKKTPDFQSGDELNVDMSSSLKGNPAFQSGEDVIEVSPKGPALNLLQRLRNEAHRFARRYHHLLIKKSLIP